MTATCTITDPVSGKSVDFVQSLVPTATAILHTINFRHSNPIITLATPAEQGTALGQNTVAINIGFVKDQFDLSFELKDGPGSFNATGTGTTNLEKLLFLAYAVPSPKTLSLNGSTFYGQIESMNIPWEAGKGNFIPNCTLTLTLCMNISMPSL